jgi:serine phosphatase RsbU (regulator of sigma subunit)/anti-sigma regulatory factor (Ser/Thr protein kinase)
MKLFRRKSKVEEPAIQKDQQKEVSKPLPNPGFKPADYEFAPNDPFLHYLVQSPGVVQLEKLELDSPALEFLKNIGVRISVPLVSQGELIGLLNLGPRMSEQDYSSDDFRLLNTLATQAAPALRVAQLARQQQIEARERERIENELRVARVIQETLLPKELPYIDNWQLDALWQPAREVSGDFYDFMEFPDGRLGIVTGDVTDKGVPAALVMATTRTIIKAVAERLVMPGEVLERTNELLCPDIPRNMFVTCLYAILDPETGKFVYANAGHNLPQKCGPEGTEELRATGMPLGLLPGMKYEEKEAYIGPGESILLYSDGLIEAHNPQGEMFGFPRLRKLVAENHQCTDEIKLLNGALALFTGPGWEQEDDVTYVSIRHLQLMPPVKQADLPEIGSITLAEFSISSEPGNERLAMDQVAEIVSSAGFPSSRIENLKTAVSEAALNAIEHGNNYDPDLPASIRVVKSPDRFTIYITDLGGDAPIPEHVVPDLDAKLEGLQSPRGWGLFLIQSMADDMKIYTDAEHHTIEVIFYTNRTGDVQEGVSE